VVVRYFDIHEDDDLDEEQLASWIEQASSPARREDVEADLGPRASGVGVGDSDAPAGSHQR
jgi:hypothetical protein